MVVTVNGIPLEFTAGERPIDLINNGAKRIGITGHSRYSKASLIAMAFDRRFAIGYISSSGEGGAKLYRHVCPTPSLHQRSCN
jgi:hypothetical protein